MSKPGGRSSVLSILGSLGWPIVLGAWATGLLYLLMYKGPLDYPIMHRYFAGHPVCYFETGLAIIGLFALPAIGIGSMLGYLPGEKKRQWGEVLLGFGLLFLGIGLLKDAIPPLDQEQLEFVRTLGGHGFLVDHLAEKRFREVRMLALLVGGRDAAEADVAASVLAVRDPLELAGP